MPEETGKPIQLLITRVYKDIPLKERETISLPTPVFSLLQSFTDSSTKRDYYWNQCYLKFLKNGNYWLCGIYQIEEEGNIVEFAPYLKLSAGRYALELVLFPEKEVQITPWGFSLERKIFTLGESRNIVFSSSEIKISIPLYRVIAKLLKYYSRMKKELNL